MRSLAVSLLILFSSNTLNSQDVWGDVSVAMPDNLNAISGNPAGLGIPRGTQFGIYIPFNSVFTMHRAQRFSGFGYDLKYEYKDGKLPNIFNPSDGNIGFGALLFHNTYAGIKWNKEHFIDLGLLYRPINQVSLGMTSRFDDKTNLQSTLGIAIRPFLNHRLTIGADIDILEGENVLSPHLTLEPFDGILLSARSNINSNDFQFNLVFNFGRNTIYSPTTSSSSSNYSGGIGFYRDTQQKKSIFEKKTKDTLKINVKSI